MSKETFDFNEAPEDRRDSPAEKKFGFWRLSLDPNDSHLLDEIIDVFIYGESEYDKNIYRKIKERLLELLGNGKISEKELVAALSDYQSEYVEERDFEEERYESRERYIEDLRVENPKHPDVLRFDAMESEDDYPDYYKFDEEGDVIYSLHDKATFHLYFVKLKVILDVLAQSGIAEEESMEAVIEMAKHPDTVTMLKTEIALALSASETDVVAKKILYLIQKEDDAEIRKSLSKILYRLELGRIGISEKGVRYLGKMYDLGLFNNPDFFVNRLTASGDIGIFDDNNSLIRHFNLGNTADDEGHKIVRPEVLSFTYETLFYERPDENEGQRKERLAILREFQEKYFSFYEESFFEETGVRFNNLSFKEQGAFMWSHGRMDEKGRESLIKLLKKYGEDAMRSFVALNKDPEIGQKLLGLSRAYNYRDAITIFKYCAKFSSAMEEVEEILMEKNIETIKRRHIMDRYLDKMTEMIDYTLTDSQEGADQSVEERKMLILHIDAITKDTILLRGLYASGIDIESEEKIQPEIINQEELSSRDFDDIVRTYALRYPLESKETKKHLVEHIVQLLNSDKTRVHGIRVGERVRSSLIINQLDENTVYAAGFHSDPILDMPIGGRLLKKMLQKEHNDYHIVAEYDPENEKLGNVYRKFGFRELGEFTTPDGKKLMKIILPKEGAPEDFDFAEPPYWR